jgi:hypothetical protein
MSALKDIMKNSIKRKKFKCGANPSLKFGSKFTPIFVSPNLLYFVNLLPNFNKEIVVNDVVKWNIKIMF